MKTSCFAWIILDMNLLWIFEISLVLCIEINEENIQDHLKKEKFSLVLFFAPWLKSCEKVVGVISEVEVYFRNRDDIFIGKIDTYKSLKLASHFRIDDYCSLKYFVKGSKVAESYEDTISKELVIKFVETKSSYQGVTDLYKEPLIELNLDNFDRIVKNENKFVIVYFYTSWCKKCTLLSKTIRQVAQVFQNDKDCVIAQLDGEKWFNITVKEKIGVYPTFVFYSKTEKDGKLYYPGKFDENWTNYNITKFLNINCGLRKVIDEAEDEKVGTLDELNVYAKHFMQQIDMKRKKTVRHVIQLIQEFPPHKRWKGEIYVDLMTTIMKEGDIYISNEINRIEKLLHAGIVQDKENLIQKKNILKEFNFFNRDEL
ncbi:uncharacterized protein LOC100199495 isoform X1 [Hydra vulgaris]|uniref:uncharacterized protein LOC100199495 isoform X1 n=1 Tax=Hydra vulgaris TaxID=6087 RepID=UPI0032EA2510